ncbi:MAG: GNAT family N-acetyltransferase [Streptosporangiaceae bacterium]
MVQTTVVRLGPDEWPVLRALRLAALADAPEAFGTTAECEQARDEAEWRRRLSGGSLYLAGYLAGAPAGLAGAVNRAAIPSRDADRDWELVSMWVAPAARGSGAADALAGAVAGAVRAAGGDRITLWIADGQPRAMAFYLRFGFTPTGRHGAFRRGDGSEFGEAEMALDLPCLR